MLVIIFDYYHEDYVDSHCRFSLHPSCKMTAPVRGTKRARTISKIVKDTIGYEASHGELASSAGKVAKIRNRCRKGCHPLDTIAVLAEGQTGHRVPWQFCVPSGS